MPGASDVAVVVPAYRAGEVLDAALASVAGQTLAPDEVVVVDDGSDDDTVEVAERWSSVLPLRVVRQPANAGPAAARRAGTAATGSSLLALLDADDVWLPDHLSSLRAVWEVHGGVASGDGYRWRPGVRVRGRTHRDHFPIPDASDQRLAILRTNFVFVGSLFARADYDEAGGFRDGFSGAEDWDLWIRLLRRGVAVHGTPAPTCLYRLSGGGLTLSGAMPSTYVRVLESALAEAEADDERSEAARALARARVKEALAEAHAASRSGDRAGARSAARRAGRGPGLLAVESLGLVAAPRAATRVFDALRRRYW